MAKRTYSQATKLREEARRKRCKSEEVDELRLPPPRARLSQSSSLFQSFRGPVSFDIHSDSDNVDTAPANSNGSSVFDRALGGKLKPVKPMRNHSIYGSREKFEATMNDQNFVKGSKQAARSQLPTPPTEIQKQQGQRASKFFPGLQGAASLANQVTKPSWSRKEAIKPPLEEVIKPDEPKQPYVPKQYIADKSCPPHRNICGDRLSSNSKEAQLWTDNQRNSPLLRLPGEIRNRIYEHVLGGNTIRIRYETYRPNNKDDALSRVVPVFKYHCTVFHKRVDPYKLKQLPDVETSTGFPLLNDVCRQLYLETGPLPFKLNTIAFEKYNTVFNFLVHEQRLTRQQRQALTKIIIWDELPGANVLTYLPNLEKVFLGSSEHDSWYRGWYKVLRRGGKEPELANDH
ncbi:hypothetical protein HBI31_006450 [Parastagonospora nodorum]|nr:hypothetical protein HBI31_006450 [Parastagonospora nodorum]